MNPAIIGIVGIVILLLVIILRMPVAFAALTVGFIGMLFLITPEAAFKFLAMDMFGMFSSYSFSVIPMFILMGYLAAAAGMTSKLFETSYAWVGHFRGGLSIATVLACAAFSGICGSGAATAATIGVIAYPEMKKFHYDDALATGCIAAGGSLGPVIPPSSALVIYALLTEQSIAQCLVSGIIPGIIIAILMVLGVTFITRRNPSYGPPGPRTSWSEKIRQLPKILDIVVLFLFVIGGLFGGLFTPTQAGAAGAIGALIIGLIHRNIRLKEVWNGTMEALRVSCMVLFLMAGSIVFGHFLSLSTLSMEIILWAQGLTIHPLLILIFICIFYIIGGCFMDAASLVVLTIPITAPVVDALGYNLIWFGVIVTVLGETGAITPPVGVCVYVIKGIAPEVPLEKIFKGILPFFVAILVGIALLIAFPDLVLFIPSLVVQ